MRVVATGSMLALTILLVGCRPEAFGQTPDEPMVKQIQRDLPTKLRAVEAAMQNLVGQCSSIDKTNFDLANEIRKQRMVANPSATKNLKLHDAKGEQIIGAVVIDFATSGRYCKCDVKPLEDQVTVSEGKVPNPPRAVSCLGPRGNFSLNWAKLDSAPDLKSFSQEINDSASRFHRNIGSHLKSMYSIPLGSLADLLNAPNFTLTRVESVEVEGHACVRVGFNWVGTLPGNKDNPPDSPQQVSSTARLNRTLICHGVAGKTGSGRARRRSATPPSVAAPR